MRSGPDIIRLAAATLLAGGALAVPSRPAQAQIAVVDTTNYAQNLLQAARALEQINNQVRSLQNQASMLQNMARNLERIDFPQLERIQAAMERIDALMGEARGIGFEVERLDERFREMFPGTLRQAANMGAQAVAAQDRLEAAMDAFRHSMGVQAQVARHVRADAALLAELVERSQGAAGSLQAQQATNQLLALGTKQQLQLQALMAAEFRSQGVERARRVQAEAEARAAARRFLGTGTAYRPR